VDVYRLLKQNVIDSKVKRDSIQSIVKAN